MEVGDLHIFSESAYLSLVLSVLCAHAHNSLGAPIPLNSWRSSSSSSLDVYAFPTRSTYPSTCVGFVCLQALDPHVPSNYWSGSNSSLASPASRSRSGSRSSLVSASPPHSGTFSPPYMTYDGNSDSSLPDVSFDAGCQSPTIGYERFSNASAFEALPAHQERASLPMPDAPSLRNWIRGPIPEMHSNPEGETFGNQTSPPSAGQNPVRHEQRRVWRACIGCR